MMKESKYNPMPSAEEMEKMLKESEFNTYEDIAEYKEGEIVSAFNKNFLPVKCINVLPTKKLRGNNE